MPRPTSAAAAHRRDDEPRGLRITALALLIAFGVAVTVITLWPGPPDPDGQRALKAFLLRAYAHGLPTWISFGAVEFAANILLFVPIGLFGALALPRHRWLVVPASIAGSIAIEVFQAARLSQRDGTPRDVIANGIGALLGYLAAAVVLLLVRRRIRRKAAATVTAAAGTVPVEG